jgi:arginyl-tRNA synthetase
LVWTTLTDGLARALEGAGLAAPGRLDRLELAIPRETSHGDWTTNLALLIAREAGQPARRIAEALAAHFPADPATFVAVEVAGPGFLNFRYSDAYLAGLPGRIVEAGERFGWHDHAGGARVLVEYVSANPTGPLNVVSARAAAVGAALVRLLRATGHQADGEFYVNDAGNQVDLLGESLAARFAQRIGTARALPEEGYQGAYLAEVAAGLDETAGRAALAAADGAAWFRDQALDRMLAWQRRDLADYGAEFARWFRESSLHAGGDVGATLEALKARGVVYERDGAQWLPTERHGDSEDRVIVKSSGTPTYLLPDIAYHRDKHRRGYGHVIDLWGPDHHGYIARLQAALVMLGLPADYLEVLIVQQVNLLEGGQPVKMSKRAGEFVTLRQLMDDVGADCAKFFFLMRSTSSHLDFDLDLARRQSDENPAYYVQYAHARIASILRFAAERGAAPAAAGEPGPAESAPEERALVRKLAAFPEVVRGAAFAREPHRLPVYLQETAAEFHRFYHACRVVGSEPAVERARLRLCDAARIVLRNGLALMGVGAPERMERAGAEGGA